MTELIINTIQGLRRILWDQYDFHSILKELIQNADDAGATQFHVGWMDNWPQGLHPLLCSPAIVFLNNGEFTSTNEKAIGYMDVGTKGGDLSSIGKFGLGMKSVFHLCEAFFFLASSNQPAAKDNGFKGELLNPWSGGMNIHDDWNDSRDACSFLNKQIETWNHGCERWFCLVVPLRTEQQLNGKAAIVEERSWDISKFFVPELPQKVAVLMPLLRFLNSITIWTWEKEKFMRESTIKNAPTALKCRFPDIVPASKEEPIRGEISFSSDKLVSKKKIGLSMEFAGKEKLLSDPVFTKLKNDESWPITATLDNETGASKDEPEKAEPHCAVVFSILRIGNQQENLNLQIRRAFFLPLAKIVSESKNQGNMDVQVLLHGHFFLDAGRKDIYSRGMENESVKDQWNKQLMDKGLYPLVLPALYEFVHNSNLTSKQVSNLTRTISETDFYKNNESKLCNKDKWFYRLSGKDGDKDKKGWCLIKSNEIILKLPVPSDNFTDRPFKVFPILSELCKKEFVTYENYPCLSSKSPLRWREQEHLFDKMLNSIENMTFADKNRLTYLADFLSNERPLPPTASELLSKKIKEFIKSCGLEKLKNLADQLKTIIKLIDKKYWVSFPVKGLDKYASRVFNDLFKENVSCLILPDDLTDDHGGKLSIKDSVEIFKYLTREDDIPLPKKSVFALRVIDKTSGSVDQKRLNLGRYPLFLCRFYTNEKEQLFCWNDLEEFELSQQLFAGGSSYAAPLQNALQDKVYYRLVESSDLKPFQILFSRESPPNCGKKTCFEILEKRPRLNRPEKRKDILNRLQEKPGDISTDKYLKVIRYLLHGTDVNFNDIQTALLREPQVEYASLLDKIAHSTMQKLGEEWRWLNKELSDVISPQRAEQLRIRHIDFNTVEKLLQDILKKEGVEWLSDLDLSRNERNELLKRIQDDKLWCQLPLHETVSGLLVNVIRLDYYEVEKNLSVPSAMKNRLRVIKKTSDISLDKRYRNSLKLGNDKAILNIICDQEKPDRFCMEILNALHRIRKQNTRLESDILKKLKESKWLPISKVAIAPKDIIYLPQIEDEIVRLLSDPDLEGAFFCIKHLNQDVRDHEAFVFMKETLFLSTDESLEALGLCLNDFGKYHVGKLNQLEINPSKLEYLLKAFDDAQPDLLPAISILRTLSNEERRLSVERHFLPNLIKKIDIKRIISCLKFLTQKHKQVDSREKKDILEIFNWYLDSFIKSDNFKIEFLKKIKLLNRIGEWVSTHFLSFEYQGIDEKFLLNSTQCIIMRKLNKNQPASEKIKKRNSTRDISLKKYFQELENRVPSQVVGGFISLLGDDKDIKKLAEEYLLPWSIEGFRGVIDWDPLENLYGSGANESIHDAMEKQRFHIYFHPMENDEHNISNLMGELFSAKVNDTYTNIFIGNFRFCHIKNYRCYIVTFRHIDPSSLTKQELIEVFYESARILIDKVYCRKPNNLKKLWDDLSQSGQLDLKIVQHQILENAFLYFKQLGSVRIPKLREIIENWNKLRRKLVEVEHTTYYSQHIDNKSIKEEIENTKKKLRKTIENDPEIKRESLEAVRHKMEKEFQYTQTSITFELFQNSDDAALELSEMLNDSTSSPFLDHVKIKWDEKKLVWMHWGRQINEFRRGGFSIEMGKKRCYDADLENMLFLSSSDKGSREKNVTGKYGLGFKSVFLLTDKPKILSGQLGFEVVGGFFPKALKPEDVKKKLQRQLNEYNESGNTGTIFELKARDNKPELISEVVAPFRKYIPLLLIFSRKIKNCELRDNQKNSKHIAWHEKSLMDCQHIFTGKIQLSLECEEITNFVIFRGKESNALLMAIGTTSIEKLPDYFPTFWVTAPTKEKIKAGFAVNGRFALDIGRAQLASDVDANTKVALEFGFELGQALSDLFKASNDDWAKFCDTLGMIKQNTSLYQFWESVWSVFGKDIYKLSDYQSSSKLIKIFLWNEDCGMAYLLKTMKALPTGLKGNYQCLTNQRNVRYNAKGIIDIRPDVFHEISKWEPFFERVKPGEIVSYSCVGSIMGKLFPTGWKREPLELKRIMEWHLNDEETISPETANCFGKIVTRDFFDELEKGRSEICHEGKELKDFLKTILFKSKNGTYQTARVLLVIKNEDEEAMRARFAPDDRVLHEDYQDNSILFFKACRPQMEAQSRVLAQWIRSSGNKEKRTHALYYLLHGELGRKVGIILQDEKLPDWIRTNVDAMRDRRSSAYFDKLKGHEQLELIGKLGYSKESLNYEHESISTQHIRKDPSSILNRIFDWWKGNRKKEIRKYEKRLYVGGKFYKIGKNGLENEKDRVEWLTLFLTGVLQTIGRSGIDANREFIKFCIKRNWLSRLARADRQPHEWLKTFEEYIDAQSQDIEYFHWMKQLIGMFIISRWLDDYVDAFLAVNNLQESFSLDQITAPRASEHFQGGGPDAPPISKVLGIGALFIMRELIRNGILKNKNAYRHCYVPVKRVRNLIEQLGCPSLENSKREVQSIQIYEFLVKHLGDEKADFLKSFDIPLLLIAGDDALWNKFFNESRPDMQEEEELS
ncbi:hypothetical protein QUF76_05610 [Desulfobacterales bacterium HSG16]|nr:hypothetical protein [Desulfobacterales bacterium HSG16]